MPQDLPTKDDPEFFYWTVRIGVHKTWVEDGFNLTNERAHDMLANDLRYAYGHELQAKVLESPDQDRVAKTQGYTGATDPRF